MANTSTSNISIRMDAKLKKQADAFFNELGMSLSTAFAIFVKQSLREGKIPFTISLETPNQETLAAMQETQDLLDGKLQAKTYTSAKELIQDLDLEIKQKKSEEDELC